MLRTKVVSLGSIKPYEKYSSDEQKISAIHEINMILKRLGYANFEYEKLDSVLKDYLFSDLQIVPTSDNECRNVRFAIALMEIAGIDTDSFIGRSAEIYEKGKTDIGSSGGSNLRRDILELNSSLSGSRISEITSEELGSVIDRFLLTYKCPEVPKPAEYKNIKLAIAFMEILGINTYIYTLSSREIYFVNKEDPVPKVMMALMAVALTGSNEPVQLNPEYPGYTPISPLDGQLMSGGQRLIGSPP